MELKGHYSVVPLAWHVSRWGPMRVRVQKVLIPFCCLDLCSYKNNNNISHTYTGGMGGWCDKVYWAERVPTAWMLSLGQQPRIWGGAAADDDGEHFKITSQTNCGMESLSVDIEFFAAIIYLQCEPHPSPFGQNSINSRLAICYWYVINSGSE